MKLIARSWSEVEVGNYIKDKNGKTWRVDAEHDGHLYITGTQGQKSRMARPPASAFVYVCEPTEEEALALVQRMLGGVVVETPPTRVPPLSTYLEDIHRHMYAYHGYVTDSGPGSKSVSKLLEFHRSDHLEPATRSHGWRNHEHHRETGQ